MFWSCSKYDTEHCRATWKTENGAIISTTGDHNHTLDLAEADVRNRLALLKSRTLTTQELPCQFIAQVVTNASQSVAASLPSSALLTRIINKTRKNVQLAPANPTSLDGLQIPASYTVTTSGDPFLLANIGGTDRFLIFSTASNLQSLASAELWHADETFKCAPALFQQLYTIHCVKDDTTLPCVFALLPDKRQQTYNRLLAEVKTLAEDRQLNLNPKEIMSDYEIGFINASKAQFPNAQHKGCYFHLGQCLWRKVQEYPDISRRYKVHDDFALKLRQLPALAFVPVQHLIASFELLMKTAYFMQNEKLLIPFVDYVEDTC